MILRESSTVAARNKSTQAEDLRSTFPRTGPWRAVSRLAGGRRTELFRAIPAEKPSESNAPYVLKVLRREQENIPESVERFRESVRIGRCVSHPSLVPVLDSRTTKPPYYMVLPWVEGGSLRARFESEQPIALPSLLWVTRQIAGALAALFDVGYTHGDVKPENILVSPDWHATLVDLEFARPIADCGDAPIPIMGTPPYLAPEILLSGARVNPRADIYALGIILFEGLAGYSPFRADSPRQLLESLRKHGVPPLRAAMPHLPEALARLVRSMTAKEPLRRPANPHEVVSTLIDMEIETFAQRQWE